ncbi:hypothetical protein M0812_12325 [Anaeramoeba flamelloides]|uniref:Uncharacterized protein n=1 Tax=Anaeramoeba flamelloides TaxID=1746091 RepID=A0AAV7ZKR5_9EUKA|nr:hypothetical protein M0812_12325 [Anaeramoeba flamelloides]
MKEFEQKNILVDLLKLHQQWLIDQMIRYHAQVIFISSSYQTYQILTESGKIWSLANKNRHKEVALLDAGQSTFEEIRPVTFFEELKLFVNSLAIGSTSLGIIFVMETNCMPQDRTLKVGWVLAIVEARKLCLFIFKTRLPKSFQEFVLRVSFLSTSKPDLLYASGNHDFGKLGIGSTGFSIFTTVVKNFKGSEILTIKPGDNHFNHQGGPNL